MLLYITKWAKGTVGVAGGRSNAVAKRHSATADAVTTSPINTRATTATTRARGMLRAPFYII